MPIQPTEKIWRNGQLIPWEQANIHVMSHVVHYGSSVFEGIRCYGQPSGAAVFRLPEHMQRLIDSAKIYRMTLPYSLDELCAAVVDVIENNGVAPCYIRPIALRGYGEIGVNPTGSPIPLAYRMRNSGGGWKIIDVFYNGSISSLAQQSSDFSGTVAKGGAPALIKKLNDQSDKLLAG